MIFGRKIVFILSLVLVAASDIWGGLFYGTAQNYILSIIGGIGTAAYEALVQLTVGFITPVASSYVADW